MTQQAWNDLTKTVAKWITTAEAAGDAAEAARLRDDI